LVLIDVIEYEFVLQPTLVFAKSSAEQRNISYVQASTADRADTYKFGFSY